MARTLIAPSILAADFSKLGEEVAAVERAGADMIHVDVMDGHFVPNISIGPAVIKSIRPHSTLPFDVHLMIAPVDPFIQAFRDAGAVIITVLPEAGPHVHRTLQAVKAAGARAGVSLNPGTLPEAIDPIIDLVDLVLVMSVNPGFGGQSFIETALPKIEKIRRKIDASGRAIVLEVDGGVNANNAQRIIAAGATALVAGTAIYGGDPAAYADNIQRLRAA
jgi:ribulose-phosphate 3-epimerase